MITISDPYFIIRTADLPSSSIVALSRRLFDRYDEAARSLSFEDYDIRLTVDEGSLKGRGRIMVAAATFIWGVLATYGSMRTGIDYVARDSRWIGNQLVQSAVEEVHASPSDLRKYRRSAGDAARIQRIMGEVAAGKKTPEDGARETLRIFERDVALPQDAVRVLRDSFQNLDDQQLELLPNLPSLREQLLPRPRAPRQPKRDSEEPDFVHVMIRRRSIDEEVEIVTEEPDNEDR